MKRTRCFAVLLALSILSSLTACSHNGSESSTASKADTIVTTTTTEATRPDTLTSDADSQTEPTENLNSIENIEKRIEAGVNAIKAGDIAGVNEYCYLDSLVDFPDASVTGEAAEWFSKLMQVMYKDLEYEIVTNSSGDLMLYCSIRHWNYAHKVWFNERCKDGGSIEMPETISIEELIAALEEVNDLLPKVAFETTLLYSYSRNDPNKQESPAKFPLNLVLYHFLEELEYDVKKNNAHNVNEWSEDLIYEDGSYVTTSGNRPTHENPAIDQRQRKFLDAAKVHDYNTMYQLLCEIPTNEMKEYSEEFKLQLDAYNALPAEQMAIVEQWENDAWVYHYSYDETKDNRNICGMLKYMRFDMPDDKDWEGTEDQFYDFMVRHDAYDLDCSVMLGYRVFDSELSEGGAMTPNKVFNLFEMLNPVDTALREINGHGSLSIIYLS